MSLHQSVDAKPAINADIYGTNAADKPVPKYNTNP